jgi:hypothetical protein
MFWGTMQKPVMAKLYIKSYGFNNPSGFNNSTLPSTIKII